VNKEIYLVLLICAINHHLIFGCCNKDLMSSQTLTFDNNVVVRSGSLSNCQMFLDDIGKQKHVVEREDCLTFAKLALVGFLHSARVTRCAFVWSKNILSLLLRFFMVLESIIN